MSSIIVIIFSVTITMLVFIGGTTASFPGFVCPAPGSTRVFYPCHHDCQHQHGAEFGNCGDATQGDYNCYCGPFNKSVYYEQSIQCNDQTQKEKYELLCDVDCKCNHAATRGKCHWDTKACVCTGYTRTNDYCKYASSEEFAKFSLDLVKEDAAGKYSTAFLTGAF